MGVGLGASFNDGFDGFDDRVGGGAVALERPIIRSDTLLAVADIATPHRRGSEGASTTSAIVRVP